MTTRRPDLTRASKFMSLLLRHDPAKGGLTLDASGWTSVDQLLGALQRAGFGVSLDVLKGIVEADTKGRYAFSPDGQHIRANQGHSVTVDLGLEPVEPPKELYHGTVPRFLNAILVEGLRPMGRHHIHLSEDLQTATAVGARRGKPVILTVDAQALGQAGHLFYRSANGVWLTASVPEEFLRVR